ncbi:MAG: hypothetical protein JOY71_24575 [Acetobacteraceae bacterium]|nr:hypothetical protein [Acetobacteraceae bacterium]MBV8589362.1 hypothetical protein [Acetobacteraceae bacterium]
MLAKTKLARFLPVWAGSRLAMFAAALLSACGDLPQPFKGAPGAEAKRLAEPPPARLAVITPSNALLTDAASREFAASLAAGLQDMEVPAVPEKLRPGDWQLVTTAEQRNGAVVPIYTVLNSQSKPEGKAEGKPVPLAAWAEAKPATLQQEAVAAAPEITNLLTSIQSARQRADPNSLYNRAARVFVADVTGAPGDGNAALTRYMREKLSQLGPVVQNTEAGADFIVRGQVRTVPVPGGLVRVEIQWFLYDPKGDQRGDVIQLNEVPPYTLNPYWGDVAVAVAQEAAGGVRDAILTQSGRRHPRSQMDTNLSH